MRAINVGDVYYLRSPFKSSVSLEHEKKLSYMLGTVSSRPAVIIRPPYAWDEYGTVTVIPALTHVKPCLTFHMYDKYGYASPCDYPFAPHTAHSVPISRLSRYIGRLEPDELEQLLYAHNWINSPDPLSYGEIPPCYKEVFENRKKYESGKSPYELASQLYVDKHMHLTQRDTTSNKVFFEMDLDVEHKACTRPDIAIEFMQDPHLQVERTQSKTAAVTTPVVPTASKPVENIPASVSNEETTPDSKIRYPVSYPVSTFSHEMLDLYANKFDVPESMYDGTAKPHNSNTDILDVETLDKLQREYSIYELQLAMDYYDTLTAFDQDFVMVRVPCDTLEHMTKLPKDRVVLVKRIANYLYLKHSGAEAFKRLPIIPDTTELPQPTPAPKRTKTSKTSKCSTSINTLSATEAEKIRPYINEKNIENIPDHMIEIFMKAPTYQLKAMYGGKQFRTKYQQAYNKYQERLAAMKK